MEVSSKLRNIRNLISEILTKWNEDSTEIFLTKARKGIYPESENDAIDLRQLLIEEKKLMKLHEDLSEE